MREDRVVSCGRWGDGVQAFAKRVAGAGDGLRADGEGSGGAGPSFKIADILREDGTLIGVEGEHDFPYLVEYTITPVIGIAPNCTTIRDLYQQRK
jgi:hypothetical protein